jgi:hypothetical protein
LRKLNEKALQKIKPIVDVGGGGFDPATEPELCFDAGNGGAWGILLRNPRQTGTVGAIDWSLGADWFVAHVDAKGKLAFAKGPSAFTASSFGGTSFGGTNNQSAVFDYDGDGTRELVLVHGQSEHTGTGDYAATVWTLKNGKVVPYAKDPGGAVGALDVDCDGRPDLVQVDPFDGVINCTSMNHMSVVGLRLAAHSLPDGSFSSSDEVAKLYARSECPARPVLDGSLVEDEGDLLHAVRCARLWGVSTSELEQSIRKLCRPPDPADTCMSRPPGVCVWFDLAIEWANAAPPFTLK